MGATLFIQREKVDVTVHLNLSLYHYYFMNSRLYTPYCCEHAHYMPTHKIFEICPNFHFTIQVCYACNQSQFIMTLKFSPPNLLVVFARCCLLKQENSQLGCQAKHICITSKLVQWKQAVVLTNYKIVWTRVLGLKRKNTKKLVQR